MCRKYIISFVLLSVISLTLNAQDVKYKDLMEILPGQSDITKHNMLKEYQRQDPFHANAYYKLGKVAYRLAQTIDPLKQYNEYNYFAYHTKVYLELCQKYLDRRSVRKQRDYFDDIELPEDAKKVREEHVRAELNKTLKAVKKMRKEVDEIYYQFNDAIDHYTTSNSLFRDINREYSKIKDIYLNADEKVMKTIENIAVHYDSIIFYLDAYQKALKIHPLTGYNQQYEVLPIITYRLEGLTTADFFENQFVIWDYRTWADSLLATINNPVNKLRKDIRVQQKLITEALNKIKYAPIQGKEINPFRVDEKLLNRIGKFDFNSMVVDMFLYQEQRINYFNYGKLDYNAPSQNDEYTMQERSIKYYELFKKYNTSKRKHEKLMQNISTTNIEKYENFIDAEFQDADNFRAAMNAYGESDKRYLQGAFLNMKNFLKANLQTSDTATIQCRSFFIPVQKNNRVYRRSGIKSKTLVVEKSAGYQYLGGYIVPENDTLKKAFIAKVNDSICDWIQLFPQKGQHTSISHAQASENGCQIIVTTVNDTNRTTNTLYKLDKKGQKRESVQLKHGAKPTFFMYDDINRNYITAYKHKTDKTAKLDTLYIEFRSDTLDAAVWTKTIPLKGELVDVVKTNEDYLFFFNYRRLKNYLEQLDVADPNDAGSCKICAYYINKNGKILKYQKYNIDQSFYGIDVYKINSETINVLGLYGNSVFSDSKSYNFSQPLFYMLTDRYGKLMQTKEAD